jgi:hypothetical protein
MLCVIGFESPKDEIGANHMPEMNKIKKVDIPVG